MPLVEQKNAPKNALPPALQDLLVREAAFVMGRNRIGQALTVAEELKDVAARTRGWRSYVLKDNKNDHRTKRKELDADVEVLEAGVKKFEAAGPVLYACVQRSLENYLREHDPEYVNGLASSRFLDDWKRLLARFEQTLGDFVAMLDKLPPAFATLEPGQVCGANAESRQLIDQSVAAARSVQEEIIFLNKIADAQRIRAGIDAITLYRQPERNWKALVHSLHFSQPAVAAQELRALMIDTKDIGEKVRNAINGEVQLASYVVGYGVTSYHERVWASLREAAPLRIKPEDLEGMLSETEDRIDQGRLEEWIPTRVDPDARTSGAATAAKVSSMDAPGAAAVAAPPPGKGLELKLNRPGPVPGAPVPATPVAGAAPAGPTTHAGDTMADLMAERTRLEGIMTDMRSSITQREEFLTQSEERLMQASQAQQEREMELEQREEQLRDLERRLREIGAPNGAPAPAATVTASKRDEFSE